MPRGHPESLPGYTDCPEQTFTIAALGLRALSPMTSGMSGVKSYNLSDLGTRLLSIGQSVGRHVPNPEDSEEAATNYQNHSNTG